MRAKSGSIILEERTIVFLTEILLGIGISLFLDIALQKRDLAILTLSIGILLTVSTAGLVNSFKHAFEESSEVYRLLERIEDPDLRHMGEAILNKCRVQLQELVEGRYTVREADCYFALLELTRRVDKTLHAVTLPRITEWGRDERSDAYLEEQRRVICEKHVKVQRVFILDQKDSQDQALQEAIKRQSEVGVDVRIAKKEKLPPELIVDFAILDEKIVVSAFQVAFSDHAVNEIVTQVKGEVLEYKTKFEQLWTLSQTAPKQ